MACVGRGSSAVLHSAVGSWPHTSVTTHCCRGVPAPVSWLRIVWRPWTWKANASAYQIRGKIFAGEAEIDQALGRPKNFGHTHIHTSKIVSGMVDMARPELAAFKVCHETRKSSGSFVVRMEWTRVVFFFGSFYCGTSKQDTIKR